MRNLDLNLAELNKGGGSNRLPGLVTKQFKLWNFHRYIYVLTNYSYMPT